MRTPSPLSLGYEGEERIARNMKRYVIETANYTFSTAVSTNLVNALAMRYLGYGIVEVGALASNAVATISRGFGVLIASISGVTSAFVISSLLRAAAVLLSLRWMPELER